MTRWAFCRPADWKNAGALAATMLSAILMVGCGGGGGGGNGGGGGPANLTGRVVTANALRTGVSGAVVTLLDAQGNSVGASATTDANGNFTFATVPANARLFKVDAPQATYFQQMARFRGNDYAYNRSANVGGPCVPELVIGGGAVSGATTLPDIQVFDNSVPPPPVFSCPR